MTTIKGSTKINNLIVDGNLNINGETNINSTSVKIKDNIITLNSKESSNKVSKGTSGIEIYRGSSPSYKIIYDENDQQLKAGLSNNLKVISSKEYVDTTIANTKTELIQQMNKSDFLNLAPQINYGEDTVKVTTSGLTAIIPVMSIFLGGYFSKIEQTISTSLKANTTNYIYLERDSSTKELKAYALTTKDIEEGSKQFSRILLARVLTNDANPIETEYYRINTGYNDYTFYHKITIKQTPNQTIHVYTTENGQRIDHTSSFFVKINSNIQYSIEIKPDLWYVTGTLQNISSSGIINQNIIVSATTANLISTNYSYDFKMEYVSSNNPPIYRFGNSYSATFPDGQNYKGNVTPIDQLGICTNLDSVIHYQYAKPLPDEIKSVFIKLVCKDGEHFLGHFIRDEFDQYGDVYHSKVLGTQENLNLFKRLYDTKEVFTCVTGVET